MHYLSFAFILEKGIDITAKRFVLYFGGFLSSHSAAVVDHDPRICFLYLIRDRVDTILSVFDCMLQRSIGLFYCLSR